MGETLAFQLRQDEPVDIVAGPGGIAGCRYFGPDRRLEGNGPKQLRAAPPVASGPVAPA
jgi:hypothetical protein